MHRCALAPNGPAVPARRGRCLQHGALTACRSQFKHCLLSQHLPLLLQPVRPGIRQCLISTIHGCAISPTTSLPCSTLHLLCMAVHEATVAAPPACMPCPWPPSSAEPQGSHLPCLSACCSLSNCPTQGGQDSSKPCNGMCA